VDPGQVRDVAYLAVAMLVGLAAFTAWLLKQHLANLERQVTDANKQRDVQLDINKGQAEVYKRIAERLDDVFEVVSARTHR
jgi:hypothetical protein